MPRQSETARHVIQDFKERFQLTDPNFYKVAYSPLTPSEVLFIGDNPGGDPDKPETVANYKEDYGADEHDFLDEDYRLAVKMRDLFTDAFGRNGIAKLCSVQVTNASFFRSSSQLLGSVLGSNREKCRPYLARIVKIVNPTLILATGMDVFRYLERHMMDPREVDRALPLPAKGQDIYYRKLRGKLRMLGGKEIDLVGFHHLSGYRWSNEKRADLAERIRRDWPRAKTKGGRRSDRSRRT